MDPFFQTVDFGPAAPGTPGVLETATNAETITGTNATKAVTPAGLTAKIDTDTALAGNLDTRIPSQKAVKAYVDDLVGKLIETTLIATRALTREECFGGLINTYGFSDNMFPTIPAAEAGMNFIVIAGATVAKYLRLDPAATDSIYLDGITTGDGKYVGVSTVTIGDSIQFFAFKTGASSYDWFATGISGGWASEA